MADADGADPDDDDDSFNAAAWSPEDRAYGLFYLMVIRQRIDPERLTKPAEVAHLKCADMRLVNSSPCPPPARREGAVSENESDDVSEGEHWEENEAASWPGKKLSWWRAHHALGEDLVVREGLSMASAELRRVPPGGAVQQAGAARMLLGGRRRGVVRLPVLPRGWISADATRAGGPRYVVSASAPRWRVVYSSPNSRDGDAIVRADPALDSDEVAVLYCGDIVEQAGPSETRGNGIVRMPVTASISHRSEADGDSPRARNAEAAPSKVLGWVTVDASSAGGPVFFKPAPDAENKRRRRRPGQS